VRKKAIKSFVVGTLAALAIVLSPQVAQAGRASPPSTTSTHVLAATSVPTIAARVAPAVSADLPPGYWKSYGWYPTLDQCRAQGLELLLMHLTLATVCWGGTVYPFIGWYELEIFVEHYGCGPEADVSAGRPRLLC
jgi:hypothetical protein